MERSLVQFGKTAIDYKIERGRRQKTVAVAVDPVEGVVVKAPSDTPLDRLDSIVHRKAKWIVDRRRHVEDIAPPPARREFVSGETFLYLGRQYRLKVDRRHANATPSVRLCEGRLTVSGAAVESADAVREQLVVWYRAHASRHLPERVAIWSSSTGYEPAGVLIRDQRKRWGSVDAKGNVRLNWRIIQAPKRLIDYVVAHELAHLRFPDHTRGFWALLGRAMPDYEERREALRRMGRALIW